MRGTVDRAKLERFLAELGRRARGPGLVRYPGLDAAALTRRVREFAEGSR